MARLLSVNVELPRDIEWKGRTVHTAIWKNPVGGRCRVGRLNLEGDDLVGHGGEQQAVFIYQIESYRYWQQQLMRTDFVHGQFSENFTIEGLPDDAVCIDRYRIGSALFEITALSRRHSDERAQDGGIADVQRTAGILFPRPAGRRGGRRRRNRETGRGEGANDRHGDQRAALFAQSSARSLGARPADRGAFAWMARVGLSQEGLAYEADVNRTYMNKLEKGGSYVGLEIIGKLASVLEVEPAELLRLPTKKRARGK